MPHYDQLPRYSKYSNSWVLYCLPSGLWAVGFVLDTSENDHLWLIPFDVQTNQPAPHPWSGDVCYTWLTQECSSVVQSFVSVRVHRKAVADFYRIPSDLALLKTITHLAAVNFRIPYYAPHFPSFFAAQIAQRVTNDRVARGEGTPMNIAPVPVAPAPDRKRKSLGPGGVPMRPVNSTPYRTPVNAAKKPRTAPFAVPVPESPVSKSMDTK
ncbi:hypothetical protein [Yaravirus sp. 'brasiliensis']|uniref:Uncharacterized protein n=1 Tax=Yaravirus sp. 'brasiliensis' TaxID=2739681 RepID=A0AAE7B7I6_9VIRU|nr:hypothetical protein QKS73_gp48 [Yaravirus brasiliensis]QKE44429.1 hypothetical protein [Yaravirus brasiliensis]